MAMTVELYTVLQIISVVAVLVGIIWRIPSKGDVKEVKEAVEKLDVKIDDTRKELKADIQRVEDRINKVDAKIDDTRKETKADMQRLEDRADIANEYHARSVDLLDAIRRQLEERREPL